jgi:hypothetical protein
VADTDILARDVAGFKVAELVPVLARYNVLPLMSGDVDTLDNYLARLIT